MSILFDLFIFWSIYRVFIRFDRKTWEKLGKNSKKSANSDKKTSILDITDNQILQSSESGVYSGKGLRGSNASFLEDFFNFLRFFEKKFQNPI
jgi:hypothetical protein